VLIFESLSPLQKKLPNTLGDKYYYEEEETLRTKIVEFVQ